MSFLKSSVWVFSSRVSSLVLAIPTSILIARALGPADKGIYAIATYIPVILFLTGSLGINIANTYYVGKDRRLLQSIVSNAFWSGLAIGSGVILLYLPFAGLIHQLFLSSSDKYYELIMLLGFPFSLLTAFLTAVLFGAGRMKEVSLVSSAFTTLSFLIALVVWFFKLGLLWLIYLSLFSLIAGAVTYLYLIWKLEKVSISKFDPKLFLTTVRYGLKGQWGNLVQFLNYRLDFFLVSYFAGATAVGIYSIGTTMAESLWQLPGAVATVLLPKVAGSLITDSNKSTPRVTRLSLLLTVILAILLAIVAPLLVGTLYGKSFGPSVSPLLLLLPGAVLFSIPTILAGDLAGRGRPEINSYIAFFSLITTVVLDVLLIPQFSYNGAAVSSTVSYATTSLLTLIIYSRISGVSVGSILKFDYSDWEFVRAVLMRTKGVLKK